MFRRICKYEAKCDKCGKIVELNANTIKTAVKKLNEEYKWECFCNSNPENYENNPCLDYVLRCNECRT